MDFFSLSLSFVPFLLPKNIYHKSNNLLINCLHFLLFSCNFFFLHISFRVSSNLFIFQQNTCTFQSVNKDIFLFISLFFFFPTVSLRFCTFATNLLAFHYFVLLLRIILMNEWWWIWLLLNHCEFKCYCEDVEMSLLYCCNLLFSSYQYTKKPILLWMHPKVNNRA